MNFLSKDFSQRVWLQLPQQPARISMTWSNKRIIYHTYALLAGGLSRGADLLQAALLQHLKQCRFDGELWLCFGWMRAAAGEESGGFEGGLVLAVRKEPLLQQPLETALTL